MLKLRFDRYISLLIVDCLMFTCSEAIPVDMMGKNPLCMNQYLNLLCSCRIPQPIRDEVFVAPKGISKHVLVAYKNEVILHRFY